MMKNNKTYIFTLLFLTCFFNVHAFTFGTPPAGVNYGGYSPLLEVWGNNTLGTDSLMFTSNNASVGIKSALFTVPAYNVSNKPLGMILAQTQATDYVINYGGGISGIISPTLIRFYVSQNNTEEGGRVAMSMNAYGATFKHTNLSFTPVPTDTKPFNFVGWIDGNNTFTIDNKYYDGAKTKTFLNFDLARTFITSRTSSTMARIIAEPTQNWTSNATTNDARLLFGTIKDRVNTEWLAIESDGYVGIGNANTNKSQYPLQVWGNSSNVTIYVERDIQANSFVTHDGSDIGAQLQELENKIEVYEKMIQPFMLFLIGILLILVAEYLQSYIYMLFSSIWFLGVSATMTFSEFASGLDVNNVSSFTFFFLLGLVTMWHALFRITQNKTVKNNKYLEE